VILRLLVRMLSHFEITGAHAQILRLLVRMHGDFEITGAHA
jgi:hypothetical protein